MDPGDNDEPSREELESRVAELEQTVSKMLPDRRGVIKGLGAAALGGAAVGASTGGASGQSAAGQVGTASNPVDVEGAQGNFNSVNTEGARINNGLDATRAKHGNVAASFEQASWGADGVQGSIDRLYGLSGGNATQILVDGSYTENVTIDTQQGTHITTWHPQSRVEYDPGAAGTATFDISVDDVDLSNLWIDGANDSSATCVYHNDRELSMRNVFLENAGKGLHADGMDELRVWGAHGQGIDNEFVDVVNTTDATLMNLEASSPIQVRGSSFNVTLANCIVHFNPGNSFLFDSQDSCIASGMVAWQPQGSGFNIKDSSVVSGISAEHGFRGVDFNGADRAVFIGAASSSDAGADVDLAFSGATKCTAIGRFDSIEFDSNSVDCRVYGSPWATVTNNGTNCSVV